MHNGRLSTEDLDGARRGADVLGLGLLRQQPATDSNQWEAQLNQHWHGRQRASDRDVELFSKPRVVTGLLRTSSDNVNALEAKHRARVDKERRLVMVGFD